jgi:membrane protein implicated in regulation of membrane protease activity
MTIPENNIPPVLPPPSRFQQVKTCLSAKFGKVKQLASDGFDKVKSLPKSDTFWKVLAVAGAIGFGAAGVGAVGFFAHMGMLPAFLAKLNALGAMGNYAIGAMAVGGAMSLLGIASTIILVRRYLDKKAQQKADEALIHAENKTIEDRMSEESYVSKKARSLEKKATILEQQERNDRITRERISALQDRIVERAQEFADLQEAYDQLSEANGQLSKSLKQAVEKIAQLSKPK